MGWCVRQIDVFVLNFHYLQIVLTFTKFSNSQLGVCVYDFIIKVLVRDKLKNGYENLLLDPIRRCMEKGKTVARRRL